MNYKDELSKLIAVSKKVGFLPMSNSCLLTFLFLARHEKGLPLVKYLYELVELGFNPFNHGSDEHLLIMIKNIIAVCDKEIQKYKL